MKTIKELAPAKINLFLDVVQKRDDGFHDIVSVMHSVNLCDEIRVSVTPSDRMSVSLTLTQKAPIPSDGRNIAVKAAMRFLQQGGYTDKIEIQMEKRIPVAAGLGGGSSDAAAVLRALNKLYKRPFSDKILEKIAAEIGSDVPFCFLGGTVLCEGRGEKMTRLPAFPKKHYVIACAKESVMTPVAYRSLDEMFHDFDGFVSFGHEKTLNDLLAYIDGNKKEIPVLYNIFEESVLPLCPGAQTIKNVLKEQGASSCMMSGSGPSVFGIFDDFSRAKDVARALLEMEIRAFAV